MDQPVHRARRDRHLCADGDTAADAARAAADAPQRGDAADRRGRQGPEREGTGMIVIGYSADPFGRAALEHGIAEAKLRQTNLLVINATSGEAYADPRFAQ